MTYGYYSPPNGTASNIMGAPAAPPVMTGEIRDMIVSSEMSRRIYGFVGGHQAWTRDYPSTWPRAIEVFEGLLFVGTGPHIEVINPRTGHVWRTVSIPGAPAAIAGLSMSHHQGQIWVVVCFSAFTATGLVRAYTMTDFALTQVFVSPLPSNAPRHAVLAGDRIVVCDTLGAPHFDPATERPMVHEVTLSGQMGAYTEVYFPNYVQRLDDGRYLITAEHENRVFTWNPADGSREMVFCAPVAPFNDVTNTKHEIEAAENGTLDPNSTFTPKKSLCAVEAAGSNTLYSPNSARLYGNDLCIADSDNHRVIVVRDGQIVTEVTGFNSPVTALLI